MKKTLHTKILIPLFMFFCLPAISISQVKATYVGISLTNEFDNSLANGTIGFGVAIERQLTKHSGIQTGLFYRAHISQQTILANNNLMMFSVSEKYMSLPLLYKFYSRIVNLSAGPSFDYFVGWRQKRGSGDLKINEYSIDPKYAFGIIARVSKSFSLSEKLYIEPELRYNRLIPNYRTFIGLGISIKYKL